MPLQVMQALFLWFFLAIWLYILTHYKLQANSIWLYIVPQGIRSLMNYIKQKYGNPLLLITENGKPDWIWRYLSLIVMLQKENLKLNLVFHGWTGMDDANNPLISITNALKDEKRIKYHNDHLMNLLAAIKYVIPSVYIYIYIFTVT